MGNEMLRKLSIKENLQNIKKSVQILCDMDQSFIWLCAAKAIVFSLPPFLLKRHITPYNYILKLFSKN